MNFRRSRSIPGSGLSRRRSSLQLICAFSAIATLCPMAQGSQLLPDLQLFGPVTNSNADGGVLIAGDGLSFILTGGNDGSGLPGTTTFSSISTGSGIISFMYSYDSLDIPQFDSAGYLLGDTFFQLSDTAPDSGVAQFAVNVGDVFGFYVSTLDNIGEPGVLTVSLAAVDPPVADAPEPSLALLVPLLLMLEGLRRQRVRLPSIRWGARALVAIVCAPICMFAQAQNHYLPANVTGELSLVRTVNLSAPNPSPLGVFALRPLFAAAVTTRTSPTEISKLPAVFPHPPMTAAPPPVPTGRSIVSNSMIIPEFDGLLSSGFAVSSGAPGFGFQGLSHFDQRLANSGNQFSVEPPNPAIAIANGLVLEGVNNAVRVFDALTGAPRTDTISSNELFGVPAAINTATGDNGVYPTDMRVFYDSDIHRWFVIQRSQDNDTFGFPLDQSHLYIAVSQTADPTGNYNIYVMDTTHTANPGCPCVPDFPQIGTDQYGLYISANEYGTSSVQFVDAEIFAISKVSLASGATSPATYRFVLPRITGFEFAIQPAATPPGASQFLANGGLEFFVSSQSASSTDNHLAVWALSNTASIQTPNPSLLLTQTSITTLTYNYPDIAVQRPGPLPYGSSIGGALAFIDGGSDSRILSLTYAGGRLFATLATQISDNLGNSQVGGAYAILSPTFRNGILGAAVLRQGFVSVPNNNVLRPAIAVNAQGRGAIAFTLAGPDYFPSSVYVSLDTISTSSTIHVGSSGTAPEDGFTGYPGGPFPGIARWGDYSGATVDTDGSIWLVSEYIPDGPRTTLANWGTFVSRYVP